MAVQMTKSQLIEKISGETEVAKKDVKGVLETLATVGYKELKKSGVFLVPGFAKFVVIKKPATKARQGTNPFTGEAMTFKAKPARKIVRARPVKAAKDAALPWQRMPFDEKCAIILKASEETPANPSPRKNWTRSCT